MHLPVFDAFSYIIWVSYAIGVGGVFLSALYLRGRLWKLRHKI